MSSEVLDPSAARSIDVIDAAIDDLFEAGVSPNDGRDAASWMSDLERLSRRLDAAKAALLDDVDRRGVYRADGHGSAKAMMRHVAKLSTGEAAGRQKSMRMLRDLHDVRNLYQRGGIGTQQVRLLGRVHANVRVRDAMPSREAKFISTGVRRSFDAFEMEVRHWERLTDADGPEPRNERNHADRDAKLIQNGIDLSWDLAARYAAMQGSSMREVFDYYIDAELKADWEKARAEYGDKACAADLPRSDAQRRADALWQLFQDAAGADGSAVPPGFRHDIVWSSDTYEEMMRRLDGEDPHPLDPDTHRCETLDGVPLEPTEAAVNSLLHTVRRVVVNAKGEVLDQGQARAFTGAARFAVKLASTTCVWPGCRAPTSGCEADHLHEHCKGGLTRPGNGAPLCGKHNRWKQKGFTVFRDRAGHWHTTRPDGTEIH